MLRKLKLRERAAHHEPAAPGRPRVRRAQGPARRRSRRAPCTATCSRRTCSCPCSSSTRCRCAPLDDGGTSHRHEAHARTPGHLRALPYNAPAAPDSCLSAALRVARRVGRRTTAESHLHRLRKHPATACRRRRPPQSWRRSAGRLSAGARARAGDRVARRWASSSRASRTSWRASTAPRGRPRFSRTPPLPLAADLPSAAAAAAPLQPQRAAARTRRTSTRRRRTRRRKTRAARAATLPVPPQQLLRTTATATTATCSRRRTSLRCASC